MLLHEPWFGRPPGKFKAAQIHFDEPGLVAAGKFKAAQIHYGSADEIRVADLRRWLRKAAKDIWDYRGLRAGRR